MKFHYSPIFLVWFSAPTSELDLMQCRVAESLIGKLQHTIDLMLYEPSQLQYRLHIAFEAYALLIYVSMGLVVYSLK